MCSSRSSFPLSVAGYSHFPAPFSSVALWAVVLALQNYEYEIEKVSIIRAQVAQFCSLRFAAPRPESYQSPVEVEVEVATSTPNNIAQS